MRNYTEFLNEEAKEKEKCNLYFSDRFKKILNKINTNNVAQELLKSEGNLVADFSWIDIDEKDSKNLSYLPLDRANRVEGADLTSSPLIHSPLWSSSLRQNMLIGKFINKLFPEKFSNNDIDKFYERYRPEVDSKKEDNRFKLISGEDIRKWYNQKMYNGEMGSCMRHDKCAPFFNMYCENPPEIDPPWLFPKTGHLHGCGLLVYLDETGEKAYGRCLVWFGLLKPSGDTKESAPYNLMDRIYVVSGKSSLPAIFKKYAIDNGWLYKEGDGGFYLDGVRKSNAVTIRLKPKDYGQYPYMDTMQYFTPATGRASSTAGNLGRDPNDTTKVFPRYNLRSQEGGFGRMD